VNVLSALYAQVARVRRAWYEGRPQRRRQLGCPVISVGNLTVGGSGKTPVVAAIAGLLLEAGYAPAILSRGYKRRGARDGVVVVSDRDRVLVDVETSGDEPQLLARRLPGVPVLVSADRALAGTLAVRRLGADVLLLDDGFQHLQVARDVDLLLMTAADLDDAVVPAGRLREPIEAARRADAVLVAADAGHAADVARRVRVADGFVVRTVFEPLRAVSPFGTRVPAALARHPLRVMAVAAIARPERFFTALRAQGYDVVHQRVFRDHHWFSAADVAGIDRAARGARADAIVTTEKDAVRLAPRGQQAVTEDLPWAFLPMRVEIEPGDAFRDWLLSRLRAPGAAV
jgi:tetraacyldisaccharide 4'-kinase